MSLADSDVGEIEAAIGRPHRPFGEDKSVLYEFGHDARREHAGNAAARLREHRQRERRDCRSGERRRQSDSVRPC